jgi:large subunit ribosomal protein L5
MDPASGARDHGTRKKGVKTLRVTWSLKGHGFQPSYLPAAWTALYRLGGQDPLPVIHRSSVSVAAWRLRQGDPVSVRLDRQGEKAEDRWKTTLTYVLPNMRPFRGVSRHGVDGAGNCAFPIQQPRVYPSLAKEYERFLALCSKPGLSRRVETSPSLNTRAQGRQALSLLGLPFTA